MFNFKKEFKMANTSEYMGGENFDLRDILIRGRKMNLKNKTEFFDSFLESLLSNKQMLHLRCITSSADRTVTVVATPGKLKICQCSPK
jgi:hypothetical protein